MSPKRIARIQRRTAETDIDLEFGLDGEGEYRIETGIGFFDHMLAAFARHGLFSLNLTCEGDLEVDAHHTVEDVGLGLGQAVDQALGDRIGLRRFGFSYVPMDEALARVVVDLSGRPYLVIEAPFCQFQVGNFPVVLVDEFFRAVANQGRLNLHIDLLRGSNDHHSIEAIFKSFGQALGQAAQLSERIQGVLSTKGSL